MARATTLGTGGKIGPTAVTPLAWTKRHSNGERIRYDVSFLRLPKAATMDSANWFSGLVQAAHLFVQSIPDAFWLAYFWAREWQALLGGLLLVFAARIFAQGTVRAARIRSAGTIRAAQIAVAVSSGQEVRSY